MKERASAIFYSGLKKGRLKGIGYDHLLCLEWELLFGFGNCITLWFLVHVCEICNVAIQQEKEYRDWLIYYTRQLHKQIYYSKNFNYRSTRIKQI